jgi:hypothetical protein
LALSLALDLALGHRYCQWAKAVLTVDDKEASMSITMSDCPIVELLTVRVPNDAPMFVKPVFRSASIYLAPHSAAPGLEFSVDLAPPLTGIAAG